MTGQSLRRVPVSYTHLPGAQAARAARKALLALGLDSGRETGGSARYYVSDDPEGFSDSAAFFLGDYAGGPVEQIRIETY